MNVLIIPEDFRNDQFILKPIFKQLFASFGKPHVKVEVCRRPLLGGVAEALKVARLREVINMYRMVDVFILCVDRDGLINRRDAIENIEVALRDDKPFFGQAAWEEVETWALAGLDLPRDWSWAELRSDVSVKERFFLPFAEGRGVADGPGQGRRALGVEAARRIDRIRQRCPEDFGFLAQRLANHMDV